MGFYGKVKGGGEELINNRRFILGISIGINLVLIALVSWAYMKMNFVKEQVLITEVQNNLVELEGLIAHQSENQWSDPNLVTTELGDVLNGLWLGQTTAKQIGLLSKNERETLQRLYARFSMYPHDELYHFADLTTKDKRDFEELRNILREVGFGLRIQMDGDLDAFFEKAKLLEGKLLYSTRMY
jgi:hypothetical protein